MQLFDAIQRTYMGDKEPHESMYAFLNRSGRPEYDQVRSTLEMWFRAIPESFRNTLRTSFRAGDQQHLGAFFEIYCHTLLKKQDFAVSLQEVVDQADGNPADFLVRASNAPLFYLEATVALDSEDALKSQRHLHQLWEALNTLSEPYFQLVLEIRQISRYSLPTTQIRNELHQWLQSLDPDTVAQEGETPGFDTRPYCSWERDGWHIVFIAVPRPPEQRGRAEETVLYQFSSGKWSGTQNTLRRALESKAGKYGTFQLPYIIAVDALALDAIRCDIEEVLFGQDVVLVDLESDETVPTRSPLLPNRPYRENGFWLARRGPRNQHVSAVLIVDELMPWAAARQTPLLWHNPWAEKPLSPDPWQGPQMVVDTSKSQMRKRQGKPGWELLHLDPRWPYDDTKPS